MNRVVHFEIHADDPIRAAGFYTSVFGWKINKWESPTDYWLITTGDKSEAGIDGGLLKRNGPTPNGSVAAYVCTVGVENIDEIIEKVKENGGRIAMPKTEIPDMGLLVYFFDTEGNIFGAMQGFPGATYN